MSEANTTGKSSDTWALRVTMRDGSQWDVPVMVIARSRAAAYKAEFGGDLQRSLDEDTLPLFREDAYEIESWAANDMNWKDVRDIAVRVKPVRIEHVDYQEGWVNGDKEVVGQP